MEPTTDTGLATNVDEAHHKTPMQSPRPHPSFWLWIIHTYLPVPDPTPTVRGNTTPYHSRSRHDRNLGHHRAGMPRQAPSSWARSFDSSSFCSSLGSLVLPLACSRPRSTSTFKPQGYCRPPAQPEPAALDARFLQNASTESTISVAVDAQLPTSNFQQPTRSLLQVSSPPLYLPAQPAPHVIITTPRNSCPILLRHVLFVTGTTRQGMPVVV